MNDMVEFVMGNRLKDMYCYYRKYEHDEALLGTLHGIIDKKEMSVNDVLNCKAIIYVLYERSLKRNGKKLEK